MNLENFIQFCKAVTTQKKLRDNFWSITNYREIVSLGSSYGFYFSIEDIMSGLKFFQITSFGQLINQLINSTIFQNIETNSSIIKQPSFQTSKCVHLNDDNFSLTAPFEYNFLEIPGFQEITEEFNNLKIIPDTVNLPIYEDNFREDDFYFASDSPNSHNFKTSYEAIKKQNSEINLFTINHEYMMRGFHLVNLDFHVEHNFYHEYFMAKVRITKAVSKFFDANVKLTGSFWYPPNGYRTWHTNQDTPGWRMYLIDFDCSEPDLEVDGKSFFRYMCPYSYKLTTLLDRPKLARFFKVDNNENKLFWHCIVNATKANRWSFGFKIPDDWINKFK